MTKWRKMNVLIDVVQGINTYTHACKPPRDKTRKSFSKFDRKSCSFTRASPAYCCCLVLVMPMLVRWQDATFSSSVFFSSFRFPVNYNILAEKMATLRNVREIFRIHGMVWLLCWPIVVQACIVSSSGKQSNLKDEERNTSLKTKQKNTHKCIYV